MKEWKDKISLFLGASITFDNTIPIKTSFLVGIAQKKTMRQNPSKCIEKHKAELKSRRLGGK